MTDFNRLNREFFYRNTIQVAKDLLGKFLVRETKRGPIIGKINEVEAYLGPNDKASHSYNYKKTKRTMVMYEKPGTLYIYLIYGMYYCLNVITEKKNVPCAVLIRSLFPVKGIELMLDNRRVKIGKDFKNLADGPGKLCMALGITKDEFNQTDSCLPDSKLFFTQGEDVDEKNILQKKRIGVEYAGEDKDLLLRYILASEKD